eukprot:1879757-Amphidinium_carterae.1
MKVLKGLGESESHSACTSKRFTCILAVLQFLLFVSLGYLAGWGIILGSRFMRLEGTHSPQPWDYHVRAAT